MTSLIRRTGWIVAVVALAACGGVVDVEDGAEDGGGGDAVSATAAQGTSQGSGVSGSGSSSAGGAGQGGEGTGGDAVGGAGGGGGGPSEVCQAMASLQLDAPVLFEAGGDALWSPGEVANFQVTLTNPLPDDNGWYPGFEITADHPGIGPGGNTLFGILGGQSVVLDAFVQADASVPAGTLVTLTFTVTTLWEECSDLPSTTLVVSMQ